VASPQRAAQIPVNKEAIRILVADVGYQEASKQTGIAYGTLRQWANRGKWHTTPTHSQAVTTVTKPIAQAHADILAEHERETRLSLAKYARRAAKDAEQASLKDSPYVKQAAQVAGIVHKWNDQEGKSTHFTLNMLNINSLGESTQPTIDVE
jgi:predicted site-specific integrase-resolvase